MDFSMATYECKICGSTDLHKVIDLGIMPNANGLVAKEELEKVRSYPLRFFWCARCTFLQQVELVPRDELFNGRYPYMTAVNTPSVENYKKFAMETRDKLPKRDLAFVIASNDGTEIRLLREFGGFK